MLFLSHNKWPDMGKISVTNSNTYLASYMLRFFKIPKTTYCNHVIKIHVRRAAGQGYSFFHLRMCLWLSTLIFYKNALDRFWEKIKNFCKMTFSPKVLKWRKCDIRTSYVTLEKLRTFSQKIHKFSNVKPKFLP